jgi:peptidoglycan L-alanyl-D-glutamate endopeptidase CwlK
MDRLSEAYLTHVHPDLAKVCRAAAQTPQPWRICYGIRTLAAEQQAVATGHSQTLHSRHLPDPNFGGVAMAVDVVNVLSNGNADPTWAKGNESDVFGQIADQIQKASDDLGIDLQWGGDPVGAWRDGEVSHFRDWGHFQLNPASYK